MRKLVRQECFPDHRKEEKEVGCNKEKVAAIRGQKDAAKATKSKGRASAVKLKKTMEHMLSKGRHNVLSYFLKGGSSTRYAH